MNGASTEPSVQEATQTSQIESSVSSQPTVQPQLLKSIPFVVILAQSKVMDIKEAETRMYCYAAFTKLLNQLLSLETTYKSNNKVKKFRTCEFFVEPVDPIEYPDYYIKIKNPICLKDMHAKAKEGLYKDLNDIQKDIELMCDNAQTFNPKGTYAWNDANYIRMESRKYILKLKAEEMQEAQKSSSNLKAKVAAPVEQDTQKKAKLDHTDSAQYKEEEEEEEEPQQKNQQESHQQPKSQTPKPLQTRHKAISHEANEIVKGFLNPPKSRPRYTETYQDQDSYFIAAGMGSQLSQKMPNYIYASPEVMQQMRPQMGTGYVVGPFPPGHPYSYHHQHQQQLLHQQQQQQILHQQQLQQQQQNLKYPPPPKSVSPINIVDMTALNKPKSCSFYCLFCGSNSQKERQVLFAPCFHLLTCSDCSQHCTFCPSCGVKIESKKNVHTT